jgi:hypothetical protein
MPQAAPRGGTPIAIISQIGHASVVRCRLPANSERSVKINAYLAKQLEEMQRKLGMA